MRDDNLQSKVAVVRRQDRLESLDDRMYQGKWLHVKVISSSTNRYKNRIGYISKALVELAPSGILNASGAWIQDVGPANAQSMSGIESKSPAKVPIYDTNNSSSGSSKSDGTGTTNNSSGSYIDPNEINGIINDIFK